MTGRSYQDPWVKKAKWLTQALIISGTLNIGLLTTFIYFAMNENSRPFLAETTQKNPTDLREKPGLQTLLSKYSTMSFQELLLKIGNSDHVESGYTKRDLALACLVAFHHFDLERALGGLTPQKREVTFVHEQEQITFTIFSGLADYQYEALVHFAKTEKWPLTPQGIFYEIQSTKPPYDPSLLEAFYLTPEHHYISLLFTKTGVNLKKEYIAALLAGGKWSTLTETSNHLRMNAEYTLEERRRLLHQLMQEKSRLAAKILLEIDQEYCLKALDNEQVFFLCDLLKEKSNPTFLKELLLNPRTEEIWKKAAMILYEQAAEEIPDPLNLDVAKRRFIELKGSQKKLPNTTPSSKNKIYIVESGDSLWKVAIKHNTSIKTLKEANHLTNDQLRVGQKLILP